MDAARSPRLDRLELHGRDIHLYPEQAGIAHQQLAGGLIGPD
jgi:hypothetical protein